MASACWRPAAAPALRRGVQAVPGAEHASHGRAPPLPHHYNALRGKGQPQHADGAAAMVH